MAVSTTEELYSFPARVAERWSNGQIQLVPDDVPDFQAYRARARHSGNEDWAENPQGAFVTVSAGRLVARSAGADRVIYTVQVRGTGANRRMYGVELRPL